MKVVVVGTRGFPCVQGGIETHCEELYPRLANLGCNITVVTRTPYIPKGSRKKYFKHVHLKHVYAPKNKSIEAIAHTFLGILYARLVGADILHVHAVGPAIMLPLARLLGLRTVFTHHGPDYDRQKWGKMAKFVLRAGEAAGVRFTNKVIVISNVIADILKNKYQRTDSVLIFNGINPITPAKYSDYIESLGLFKKRYIIAVGRFVEEKGFHDLIEAFASLNTTEFKLVLVGDADHETSYSRALKETAKNTNNVVLTGFVKGEQLRQLFTHARLFVMPSYHEGLPIALLEAMNYNLSLLVSDIPANLEIQLDPDCYFNTGVTDSLIKSLHRKLKNIEKNDYSKRLSVYNWDAIALATRTVYSEVATCSDNTSNPNQKTRHEHY